MPNIFNINAMMPPWNDSDESTSLSSDSGFESADETRPSSAASVFSMEGNSWSDCSGLSSPMTCAAALPVVQNATIGLLSYDASLVKASTLQLFHLCRWGFTDLLITYCPEIFETLRTVVTTVDICKDTELTHCLSGIFYYLTEHESILSIMSIDAALTVIAKILSVPLESSLYYTVTGLHNLLEHRSVRDKLRTPPIVTLLIQILWTCFLYDKSFHPPATANPYLAFASSTSLSKFLSIICDSIYLLAHRNEMAKRLIHAKQGVIPILYFVHTYPFEKLQGTCSRLLRILSTHPQTKKDILTNDPDLGFFKRFVNSPTPRQSLNAYWTLRNLSDECGSLSHYQINEISDILIERLRSVEQPLWNWKGGNNSSIQERCTIGSCISGTLANFTCRNPLAKTFLVEVSTDLFLILS